jgi:micrococcal nuclease
VNNKLYNYKAVVDRVVDGDTVDVIIQLGFDISFKARIRLLGVNAPESRTTDLEEKKLGLAAKAFVVKWLEDRGNTIIIATQLDKKGKFGRILGLISEVDGDETLNYTLLAKGHASPYTGGKR